VNCVTLGLDLRIMSASLLTAMITSERSVPCKGVSSAKRRPILGPFRRRLLPHSGDQGVMSDDECKSSKFRFVWRFEEVCVSKFEMNVMRTPQLLVLSAITELYVFSKLPSIDKS
jgi:hypothetical protein